MTAKRPWKMIADEIAKETDIQLIIELTDELNAAIAEQGVTNLEDSQTE